jgi:hypothetical protein
VIASRSLHEKEQHHDGQQDVADVEVDIPMLDPAQLVKKPSTGRTTIRPMCRSAISLIWL